MSSIKGKIESESSGGFFDEISEVKMLREFVEDPSKLKIELFQDNDDPKLWIVVIKFNYRLLALEKDVDKKKAVQNAASRAIKNIQPN